MARLLRRPEISIEQIRIIAPDMPIYARDVDAQAEIQIKYEGYVNRQMEMVERFQKIENLKLPDTLDYADINGLSKEAREKLSQHPSALSGTGFEDFRNYSSCNIVIVDLS